MRIMENDFKDIKSSNDIIIMVPNKDKKTYRKVTWRELIKLCREEKENESRR